jgi:two-component system, LytTR family, response regulator
MQGSPNHLPLPAAVLDADRQDRGHLRNLLLAHPSVDLKAELSAPEEIRETIESIFLRLLFCDLGHDPAQILAWLANRPPTLDVILMSEEEKWAARAFEVDALDFLLKPLSKEQLNRSLRRLLRLDWSGNVSAAPAERAFVPFERGRRLVSVDEICAIQAIGNYTRILFADGTTEIAMRTLRRWEETLPKNSFLRIHRSTLANRKRVRRIELTGKGDECLAEVDGITERLAVSRRSLGAVRAVLCVTEPKTARFAFSGDQLSAPP